jgi:adenosylcobyric acid synthase
MMQPEKQVRNVTGTLWEGTAVFTGYEIHVGKSEGPSLDRPFLKVDGAPHGAVSADGQVMGGYVHGLFESGAFRRGFLAQLGAASDGINQRVKVERALDQLADEMEVALDLDGLLSTARRAL